MSMQGDKVNREQSEGGFDLSKKKPPYPSTLEDFRRHYETHSKAELLEAVANLSVMHNGQLVRANRLAADLEATVEYMNEGCICGRAPQPKHPVDPRLLTKPKKKTKE